MVSHITHKEAFDLDKNTNLKNSIMAQKRKYWSDKVKYFTNGSRESQLRWEEFKMAGANLWLHCIPVDWKPNLSLPKQEFIDALFLRFNQTPQNLPHFFAQLPTAMPLSQLYTLIYVIAEEQFIVDTIE